MKYLLIALLVLAVAALEGAIELTDQNFKQQVQSNQNLWLVMFSASWCQHCIQLKPEITKLSSILAQYGVKVGHVSGDTNSDQVNEDLIIDYVMDKKTHLLSYPKLLVFQGKKKVKQVPLQLHTADAILGWMKDNYKLQANAEL